MTDQERKGPGGPRPPAFRRAESVFDSDDDSGVDSGFDAGVDSAPELEALLDELEPSAPGIGAGTGADARPTTSGTPPPIHGARRVRAEFLGERVDGH
ncbi:MAG TPA: hypothetical protein PKU97_03105, partial [Kofleriaceae bacterium]|nr:hypothetical protein [Kofleriaceae bacterium]